MKRIGAFFLTVFIFMGAVQHTSALGVSAEYACAIDAATGKVLYEKNAYTRHSMASTTKIMTALVALENCSGDEIVTVSSNAAGTEGSSIYLEAGEKIRMEDLLYGLMLESGNDAAIAVAEHVAGNVEKFAAQMTQKAKEIGANDTQFQNPNGLDEDGHYTTAYDLALIAAEAMKNETFAQIVGTRQKSIPAIEGGKVHSFSNHNKLLNLYAGCEGIKTGYTKKTGRCLVSSASKNQLRVIAVTLNAPDDWNDHIHMLDDAFESYRSVPLVIKDMILKTIPVKSGAANTIELLADSNFSLTLPAGEGLSHVEIEYDVPQVLEAPITKDTPAGTLRIFHHGEKIQEIPLLTAADVPYQEPEKDGFFENLKKFLANWLQFS